MPNINHTELIGFVTQIFTGAGAPQDTAELVARSLVMSDMAGHESHGVVRVRQYLDQIGRDDIDPKAKPEIIADRGAVFNVDAHKSFGQLSASFTVAEAIRRAKQYGICTAGLFHSGHVGRLGEWVEMAADENTIALAFCNGGGPTPGRVAPFGAAEPLLGTNPVAAGIPVDDDMPVVLDFATSAVAEGKVRVARNRGKSIPEGWILNSEGLPTTDPNDLYNDGVLLPAAGHKGYGLSLLVEFLGGILAGNSCPGLPEYLPRNGVLFIVLDIAAFQPADQFLETSGKYAGMIRTLRPAPGFDEVLLPGDPEHRNIDRRMATGIDVDDTTWGQLTDAAATYGVDVPQV
jgi:LDH2 family malate/lactate/ureidoglycolate dehydrogenase